MTCHLCNEAITAKQKINYHHHRGLKSAGGTETAPTHDACHRRHHSENGDFARFGRMGGQASAATKRWALNLRNVKFDPLYDSERDFYSMFYAR